MKHTFEVLEFIFGEDGHGEIAEAAWLLQNFKICQLEPAHRDMRRTQR